MERARELLADPRLRVSEVAYAVGFTDANHFAKSFRRHYGLSPTLCRERELSQRHAGDTTPV
jgi:two-component system response regulator YesN